MDILHWFNVDKAYKCPTVSRSICKMENTILVVISHGYEEDLLVTISFKRQEDVKSCIYLGRTDNLIP